MASAVAELRPLYLSRSTCRPIVTGLAILSSDLLAVALSWSLAVAADVINGATLASSHYLGFATLSTLLLTVFALSGLYPGAGIGPVEELRKVVQLTTVAYIALVLIAFLFHADPYPRLILVLAWILCIPFVLIGRHFVRKSAGSLRWWGCPAVMLGAGPGASAVLRALRNDPGLGIRVHVAVDERESDGPLEGLPLVVGLSNIPGLVRETRIKRAIIAGPMHNLSVPELVRAYGQYFPTLIVCPDVRVPSALCVGTSAPDGLITFGSRHNPLSRKAQFYKRAVDVMLSLSLATLLAPLLLIVACAVVITSHGSAFYGHKRLGKDGKVFKMWKFRTMVVNADKVLERHLEKDANLRLEWERDHKLRSDPRVTSVGVLLRKCSLDELPQVWNVLVGEMSFIGPRPIVSAEISRYGDQYNVLARVAPGLTGLWQVSGRNNTTYQERVELDSYYVQNWSPWLDIYVLSRTFGAVVSGRGAC